MKKQPQTSTQNSKVIQASPEIIYQALTDPEALSGLLHEK